MDNMLEQMQPTRCAVCATDAHDRELYPANFRPQDLSPEVFSARRTPDRIHYRTVVCRRCGLLRSNPVLGAPALARLYEQSHFTYAAESQWAAKTYAAYFLKHMPQLSTDARLLEIGCGNGTFLQEMYNQGYKNICGVEPSREAIEQAGKMKGLIRQGMFGPGLFPSEHFDVIVAFQVFDHLADPSGFLDACRACLKPQGSLFLVMHDIGAWTARLLGRHCPMIDIEHPFLYNRATLRALLQARGFQVQDSFSVSNTYPLRYWGKLFPAPRGVKQKVLDFLGRHPAGDIALALNAGNMGVVAVREH